MWPTGQLTSGHMWEISINASLPGQKDLRFQEHYSENGGRFVNVSLPTDSIWKEWDSPHNSHETQRERERESRVIKHNPASQLAIVPAWMCFCGCSTQPQSRPVHDNVPGGHRFPALARAAMREQRANSTTQYPPVPQERPTAVRKRPPAADDCAPVLFVSH